MTDMEQLAQWMLTQSIPTGHGDSMEGLLEELGVWVGEMREERDHYKAVLEPYKILATNLRAACNLARSVRTDGYLIRDGIEAMLDELDEAREALGDG